MKTIKVYSNPNAMVPDFDAQARGFRRFIGRRFNLDTRMFELTGSPVSIPLRAEYQKALKRGDLIPADEATKQLLKRLS